MVFRGASRRLCLQPTSSSAARQPGNPAARQPARQPGRQPGSSVSVKSIGFASVSAKVSVKIMGFALVSGEVSVKIIGFAIVLLGFRFESSVLLQFLLWLRSKRVRVRLLYS